jgi:hypothetical protein
MEDLTEKIYLKHNYTSCNNKLLTSVQKLIVYDAAIR